MGQNRGDLPWEHLNASNLARLGGLFVTDRC